MKTSVVRRFFPIGSHALRPQGIVWTLSFLFIALAAIPCRGQDRPVEPLPKVLMIEFHVVTPYATGLYKAIRAQLSATPLTLDRIGLADERTPMPWLGRKKLLIQFA